MVVSRGVVSWAGVSMRRRGGVLLDLLQQNEKRSAARDGSVQQTFLFVLIVSSAGVLFVFGFLLGLLGGDDGLLGLHGGGGGDGAQAAIVAEPAVVGFGNEHQANFRI